MRATIGQNRFPLRRNWKLSRNRKDPGMGMVRRSFEVQTKQVRYTRAQQQQLTGNLHTNRRAKTDHSGDNAPHPELASNVYFGSQISVTVDFFFPVVYIWTLTFRIFDPLLPRYVTLRSHLHECT